VEEATDVAAEAAGAEIEAGTTEEVEPPAEALEQCSKETTMA
jgi:hypothetical protein